MAIGIVGINDIQKRMEKIPAMKEKNWQLEIIARQ
jgi:hypothetical protein